MLYSVHCGRVIMIRLVHVCWHLIRERVPHRHWLLLSRVCGTNHILIKGNLRPIVVHLVLLYQFLECLLVDRLVYKVAMTCISVHCPLIYLHCRVARLILFVVLGCPSRVSSRVRAALSHHEVLVGPLLGLPLHLVELLQLQLFGDFHRLLLLRTEVVPAVEDLSLRRLV